MENSKTAQSRLGSWSLLLAFAVALGPASAIAEDGRELIRPPVCSANTAGTIPQRICEVTPIGGERNRVNINLTAQTSSIEVGGYSVITENYNGNYLTPVVEAESGDTVAARLVNLLGPRSHTGGHGGHGEASKNPTNLHYFHGGIVTPNNARPKLAQDGDGDNIYVYLKNERDEAGEPLHFDFKVPIPGEGKLDARVLEKEGYIPHPPGLNWYHSHLHGISSDQVLGGMSGLLSVGNDKENVKACKEGQLDPDTCEEDPDATAKLRSDTDVRYVLLRDIVLEDIKAAPEDANGDGAKWAPWRRDYLPQSEEQECAVWKAENGGPPNPDRNPKLRKGFCQLDENSAWLFTLNGQRFPTVTVERGRNVLLRMGNLSSNVAYWLEIYSEQDEKTVLDLTLIGLDGVVPVRPVSRADIGRPVRRAFTLRNLLLMPASRAEIYIRNDFAHEDRQHFVLRTKGVDAGSDHWPEIQLARIVLEPNPVVSEIQMALNTPVAELPLAVIQEFLGVSPMPKGCVRDLLPGEHRRVSFNGDTVAGWSVTTEIVHHPPDTDRRVPEWRFRRSEDKDPEDVTTLDNIPFEEYDLGDGLVDWEGERHPHVCIRLDNAQSHKQLWVLTNNTGSLHNFHIHQMKFRLATESELKERLIQPPEPSHTCPEPPASCDQPNYKFYSRDSEAQDEPLWHDTMPMPAGETVFLIMSYDAEEQVGRFVFHCHILKHEDKGLMAPIEVWNPKAGAVDR